MDAVYRARDTKLNRDVALKVLLPDVANDPERLARFRREAQVLASLNHPHIGAIHGLEESNGTIALVMELVEGEDLSQRIARGPIPLDEALPIARQIAEALEAAHEQGIVHRDLKPANIKVRDDGTVKVLDFGLAKAIEPVAPGRGEAMQAATITSPAMTQAGAILGTAAYMAPEQAKGRPVDKRADIWALGCVLYEMLTGVRPFVGEDVADTLAHILTKEPDWSALPAQTPAAIRRLLRKCVERDRTRRLDSAQAVRLEIDGVGSDEAVASAAAVPVPIGRSARVPWAVAVLGVIAAAAAIAGWAPWRATPQPSRLAFEVPVASGGGNSRMMFAVSPDGLHIVARVQDAGTPRLWVRPLAQTDGTVLPRTDGAAYPFWSPDGRTIGFFADGKLKAIDLGGSALTTVTDAPNAYGGSWNRDGVMLFSSAGGAISGWRQAVVLPRP